MTGYGNGVIGRIPILDIQPVVECGRRPAKAVAGETFQVSATVIREGHGVLGAGVVLRDPTAKSARWSGCASSRRERTGTART